MDLLIDIGNSRIKWAYAQAGTLSGYGSTDRGDNVPESVAGTWLQQAPPARVVVSNVAGSAYAAQLTQWVSSHWQQAVEYLQVEPDVGLALAYTVPNQLGVDRWLAMLAASQMTTTAVAVIDAGTAVTVDVITTDKQHLGGIIIPGAKLMSESLLQTASGIQSGLQYPSLAGDGVLGRDTNSCIEQGALFAVTGAIEHLLHSMEAKLAMPLSIIICGGDAVRVMDELKRECCHVPDLVLQGMQIRIKGD